MELLQVKDLRVHYTTEGAVVRAVNGIDLSIRPGEALGLVGETGAGKTTTALGLLRLVPDPPGRIVSGEIFYQGEDLLKKTEKQMRAIRGNQISMIFQDPMTALNPVIPVDDQIAEVIRLHRKCSRREAEREALRMLEKVGIQAVRAHEYPHQFSGGMKQRVVIAIALACDPKLLIADEPTTALDVTIQAQVLVMIKELQRELGTSMLLITHDLGVVAGTCDSVAVMYAGEIVEYGSLEDIFDHTAHPYTIGLMDSIPSLDQDVERLKPIPGLMPDPTDLPEGCSFSPRCPRACDICRKQSPPNAEIAPGHFVRCHRPETEKEVASHG
ncbi:MAG: ABC transporter ATP-binding protein [Angelakisella sp.]|nr:ABC transporter ATP-binding protein [Angelakisella sp.]